jgi:sterol desaturase/sphingolipid hydroxylase (fatty acid hydroxylase superfamily)
MQQVISLYGDDSSLSPQARFTLWTISVHSFTFVYDFAMVLVKRNGLFKEYQLQSPRSEPEESLVHDCLIKNLRSHYFLLPLVLYYFAYDWFTAWGMKMDHASWQQVEWATIGRDLFVSLIVNDTGFYWSHRALHIPVLYKAIHKQHHQFKQPIAQAAEWAHPIEDIFGNIGPTLAGPFLMGSHMYLLLFWLFLRMWKTLDAHSGYSLPFPLSIWHQFPGQLGSDMHDFHHESKEGMDSCFGAMTTFWDYVCGTDQRFYTTMQARSKSSKSSVSSKTVSVLNEEQENRSVLRRSPRSKK